MTEKEILTIPLEVRWTDGCLREYWRRMGGKFHGPNVETGTMPEAKLLPMLQYLLCKAGLEPH
jgi:hypothetical protein